MFFKKLLDDILEKPAKYTMNEYKKIMMIYIKK